MKTIFFMTLFIVALACSQTLPKQQKTPIVVTTCDTTITIRPHGTFTVQLPALISTGFSWGIATQSDPSVIVPPSNEIVTQTSADERDGRTETQVIQLTAADKKGTTVLTLHYRRPFEKNKAPAKICTITVVVN
jgi:inhibitor of cysteine peptidase